MSSLVKALAVFLTIIPFSAAARAQSLISLMAPGDAWSFNNGPEFPGATGGLSFDEQNRRAGRPSLKLVGDFAKGGNYVQAGRKIDHIDIQELTMWVRSPDMDQFTARLNDASGQTHQIVLKLEPKAGWQRVVLPLEHFFTRRGRSDAVTNIAKYESWGGAKDGLWHGPAEAIYLLLGHPGDRKAHTLWLSDVAILPRPTAVPGASVASVFRLDEILEGEHDWRFTRGEEFPGAKGSLTVVNDPSAPGGTALKLAGDFNGGGAYVAALKDLKDLDVKDLVALRLRVKSSSATLMGIQLVDGTGQTHQRKDLPITADGQWHELTIKPTQVAGGEHWGGVNDGQWHNPPALLSLSLSDKSDEAKKQPVVLLAEVRAETLLPVFSQPAAFQGRFDQDERLPEHWTAEGNVMIDASAAAPGGRALVLARPLDALERPCSVTSPAFAAAPGQWEIALASKSDLNSPDNSYNGVVTLECLDGGGKVVERLTLADVFGKHDWQPSRRVVELPKGVASARFHVQLNKTHGRFWVDELSAAYLAPAPRKDDRVSRILFTTARLGNLLLPGDPLRVTVDVEAIKPLRDDQHTLTYEVRDYWGAEQMRTASTTLKRSEPKDGRFHYQAALDLSGVTLKTGRYYELHAALSRAGGEPFRNFTSLAILPEAETKHYKPEDVPFTSRNWDNRLSEYLVLSDRLGLRTCGIWGGWSSQPPYKPEAPSIELCQKLGMGVLTGTPAATIEQGKKEYSAEALRQGVRNFIKEYGKYRPLTISLGNEPHGTGDRVRANVEAYRVVYEEVKKVDPSIFVVATSVEPNEEYFKAGYGQWCDAYDFHIYESAEDVRKAIDAYKRLMKQYGPVKPIWSTELGLNSQGVPRHVVAGELYKKFATFFAAGGVNASWFGLLYPDGDGKSYGSSGDSHNVFDCRYNHYAPRLDAIAYYNAVNAIAIKKFTGEFYSLDGHNAILFRDRDGNSLQVHWMNTGVQDVFVPLKGVEQVQTIGIDGSRKTFDARGEGITVSITEDPLLLLYKGGVANFDGPKALAATFQALPRTIARHAPTTLTVALNGANAADLDLIAPPFWGVKKTPANDGQPSVRFTLTPPENTAIREADLRVTLGKNRGEIQCRIPVAE